MKRKNKIIYISGISLVLIYTVISLVNLKVLLSNSFIMPVVLIIFAIPVYKRAFEYLDYHVVSPRKGIKTKTSRKIMGINAIVFGTGLVIISLFIFVFVHLR